MRFIPLVCLGLGMRLSSAAFTTGLSRLGRRKWTGARIEGRGPRGPHFSRPRDGTSRDRCALSNHATVRVLEDPAPEDHALTAQVQARSDPGLGNELRLPRTLDFIDNEERVVLNEAAQRPEDPAPLVVGVRDLHGEPHTDRITREFLEVNP